MTATLPLLMPRDIDACSILRLVIVRFEGLEAETPAPTTVTRGFARV